MSEPGQSGDRQQQAKRERNANPGQRGRIGDQRTAGRGNRDGDREGEVDDQGADWEKGPALTERSPRSLGRATALREIAISCE